jgi:hypothetical protein
MSTKICATCKTNKPLSDFYPHKKSKGGYIRHCKQCVSRKRKEEYCPDKTRSSNLKSKYGVTEDEYNKFLVEQNNKCAICFKPNPEDYHGFCVDHDHVTGQVRGLLCHNCNAGLGHFYDNISYLLSAASYIKNKQ